MDTQLLIVMAIVILAAAFLARRIFHSARTGQCHCEGTPKCCCNKAQQAAEKR